MKILALLAALILAGFAAYVRLAPSDKGLWNTALPATGPLTGCGQVAALEGGARLACAAPVDALARLDAIAMATPRTLRLAGSPETGRITWITRSRLWGFPDYTTAQITETDTGPRLDIFARLRFGRSDLGVNAARLQAWVNQL